MPYYLSKSRPRFMGPRDSTSSRRRIALFRLICNLYISDFSRTEMKSPCWLCSFWSGWLSLHTFQWHILERNQWRWTWHFRLLNQERFSQLTCLECVLGNRTQKQSVQLIQTSQKRKTKKKIYLSWRLIGRRRDEKNEGCILAKTDWCFESSFEVF